MSGWEWIIGLTVLGTVLICVEMFVPGMVLGILGTGCLIGAVVLAFQQMGARTGFAVMIAVLALGSGLFVAWVQWLPRSPVARWIMLRETNVAEANPKENLQGQEGVAQTSLRPAGVALIADRRQDVVSENSFIEAGARVRVVRVEGSRIVVRACETV